MEVVTLGNVQNNNNNNNCTSYVNFGGGGSCQPRCCMVHNQYLFVRLWRWKIKAMPRLGCLWLAFHLKTLQLRFSFAFPTPKHHFFLIPKSDTKFYNCFCFSGEIQLQWNLTEREDWGGGYKRSWTGWNPQEERFCHFCFRFSPNPQTTTGTRKERGEEKKKTFVFILFFCSCFCTAEKIKESQDF